MDRAPLRRELDLASELFHRINRIIPQNQKVLWVPPDCLVREAIRLMGSHGYSQLPVVASGKVLGVFSYRSFAMGAAKATLEDFTKDRCAPGDLRVDEFLEQFQYARVTEEMRRVFDAMDRDNGILVGSPECLIGVLTPMDFLRYLYQVASPFVLVSEIELALRALIGIAFPPGQLAEAARRCLASVYEEAKIPTTVEEMTFDNYQSLIAHGENWSRFLPIFGGTRTRVAARLKEIGSIRNDLFHFKREISLQDHETLGAHRDWLLAKVTQAEPGGSPEAKQ